MRLKGCAIPDPFLAPSTLMSLIQKLKSHMGTLAACAAVIFFNNAFAGVVLIPSGSMEPTLQVGDYAATNRLAYGFHLPFFPKAELFHWANPKRGEVVLFNAPTAASPSQSTFIKRVVGEPGDTIAVSNHHIIVNGKPLAYRETSDPTVQVELMDGHPHLMQVGPSPIADMPPYRVPENAIFVMGDHRDNSSDSRVWGPVELSRIRGRALGVVLNVTMRPDRFFASL